MNLHIFCWLKQRGLNPLNPSLGSTTGLTLAWIRGMFCYNMLHLYCSLHNRPHQLCYSGFPLYDIWIAHKPVTTVQYFLRLKSKDKLIPAKALLTPLNLPTARPFLLVRLLNTQNTITQATNDGEKTICIRQKHSGTPLSN